MIDNKEKCGLLLDDELEFITENNSEKMADEFNGAAAGGAAAGGGAGAGGAAGAAASR